MNAENWKKKERKHWVKNWCSFVPAVSCVSNKSFRLCVFAANKKGRESVWGTPCSSAQSDSLWFKKMQTTKHKAIKVSRKKANSQPQEADSAS